MSKKKETSTLEKIDESDFKKEKPLDPSLAWAALKFSFVIAILIFLLAKQLY